MVSVAYNKKPLLLSVSGVGIRLYGYIDNPDSSVRLLQKSQTM